MPKQQIHSMRVKELLVWETAKKLIHEDTTNIKHRPKNKHIHIKSDWQTGRHTHTHTHTHSLSHTHPQEHGLYFNICRILSAKAQMLVWTYRGDSLSTLESIKLSKTHDVRSVTTVSLVGRQRTTTMPRKNESLINSQGLKPSLELKSLLAG